MPCVIFLGGVIHGDCWFMLNHGRYIIEHGLYPSEEPFTIHKGLSFTFQKWLCCVLFYGVYSIAGDTGIKFLCLIIFEGFLFMSYRLFRFFNENTTLCALITLVMSACFASMAPMAMDYRPQLFTYFFLTAELYVLEKYVKERNWKLLIWIPLMSLLEIQLHSTIWPILILFMFPYMFDFSGRYTIKGLGKANYPLLPIWITCGASVAVALINPYGIDSLVYLIDSLQIPNFSSFAGEMRFQLTECFILIFPLAFLMVERKNIDLRFLFLLLGTLMLSFMAYRNVPFFVIAACMVIAAYAPVKVKKRDSVIISICVLAISGTLAITGMVPVFNDAKTFQAEVDAIKSLKTFSAEANVLNGDVNLGSALEFYGFHPFDDNRLEVFSMEINKKENILYEKAYAVHCGELGLQQLLIKYDFDYVVIIKGRSDFSNSSIRKVEHSGLINKIKETDTFVIYEVL